MTIKEVCEQFNISADTIRYYERVGVIPPVNRNASGIRQFTEEDLGWLQTMTCFRGAGMPIEMLIEYRKLFEMGDETISARCELLKEARQKILEEMERHQKAIDKLNYKIARYEEACVTGKLVWEEEE